MLPSAQPAPQQTPYHDPFERGLPDDVSYKLILGHVGLARWRAAEVNKAWWACVRLAKTKGLFRSDVGAIAAGHKFSVVCTCDGVRSFGG